MNIFQTIAIKISLAFSSLLIAIGVMQAPTPVEPVTPVIAPVEIVQDTAVKTDPSPVVKKITPKKVVTVETHLPVNKEALEVVTPIVLPEPATIYIKIEEPKPAVKDDIFREQGYSPMTASAKAYSITPQKGSPLKARENISLEEVREYVIATNYQIVSFREKMATASEAELLDYLKANGFTIEIK